LRWNWYLLVNYPWKLVKLFNCEMKFPQNGKNWMLKPNKQNNWAASWQNQHNGFATSMDPDHSTWSWSMLFNPVCLLVIGFVSEQHGSWSDCADAPAGLDPCWWQMHYVCFFKTRHICYFFYLLQIKNTETGLCILSEDEVPVRNSLLTLGSCDRNKKYQVISENYLLL
jgi:hypothetical protein